MFAKTPVIVKTIGVNDVVTLNTLLGDDVFPAASFALTVMEYEVPALSPEIFAEVPETVVTNVPF